MKRNLTGKGQEKTVAEWHQAKRSTMSRWKTVCIVVVHIWAKDSTLATARRGGIEQRRGESRWECMVAFGWLRQEESRRVRRPSQRGRGLDGWSAKPVDAFKAFSRGAGKFRCPILVSVFTFRALLSRFCQRLRRKKKEKDDGGGSPPGRADGAISFTKGAGSTEFQWVYLGFIQTTQRFQQVTQITSDAVEVLLGTTKKTV